MADCTHDCASCGESCSETVSEDTSKPVLAEGASVGRVVAVTGSKGGVGRTTVACTLAVELQRRGLRAAVLDADVTGSSVPAYFGVSGAGTDTDGRFRPALTQSGIQLMSVEYALDGGKMPLAWRGELTVGALAMFWSEVLWDRVDVLLVDLPAGLNDVPIAAFQMLPLDGVVIVTQPTRVSATAAAKSAEVARMMGVPVVGLVENMSDIFGGGVELNMKELGTDCAARVPFIRALADAADGGKLGEFTVAELVPVADAVAALV